MIMKNLFSNNINPEEIEKELGFNAVRSSGSGGQNVNKVATAVQLRFDVGKLLLEARSFTRSVCIGAAQACFAGADDDGH